MPSVYAALVAALVASVSAESASAQRSLQADELLEPQELLQTGVGVERGRPMMVDEDEMDAMRRPLTIADVQADIERRGAQAEKLEHMHDRDVPETEAYKQGTIEKFMLPAIHTAVTYGQKSRNGHEVRCIPDSNGGCLPYIMFKPSGPVSGIMFYCHPNAEDIGSGSAEKLANLVAPKGVAVIAVEFPGYGQAEGAAVRSNIDAAMARAIAHVHKQWHVPMGSIVIVGYSIGSGIAAELATHAVNTHGGIGGLVLIAPYSSVKSITTMQALQILPSIAGLGSFVPDNYWNTKRNLEELAQHDVPVFLGYGLEDGVVPAVETRKLLADAHAGNLFSRGFHVNELLHGHENEVPAEAVGQFIHSTVMPPSITCPEFEQFSAKVDFLAGRASTFQLNEEGTEPLDKLVRPVGYRLPESGDGIAIDGFMSIFQSLYTDRLYGEQSNADWATMALMFTKGSLLG